MKRQRLHRGNHVRHGKVARLPNETRNLVNTMLNDGCSYSSIVHRLSELGHHDFTIHSICRWRKGGYEDWLAAQEKFDLEKLRAESTAEEVKQFKDPSALEDASEILAALNTFRALREIQRRPADELLDDPSNTFLRLARITNRQTAERTRRERLQLRQETTEEEVIKQLVDDPKRLRSLLEKICALLHPDSPAAAHTDGITPEAEYIIQAKERVDGLHAELKRLEQRPGSFKIRSPLNPN